MEPIIVRKRSSHRIFAAVFSIISLILIGVFAAHIGIIKALIASIPLLLILVPMFLYYFSWHLDFGRSHIVKHLFFRETRRYSYIQLRDVEKRFYGKEGYCITMTFLDGRTIWFRMDDEQAAQAIKKLKKHRSIRTPK